MAPASAAKPPNRVSKAGSHLRALPEVPSGSRRRWRLIVPGGLALAVAVAFVYYEFIYSPAHTTESQTLQTSVARRGDIVVDASGSGTLQGAKQIDLAFRATGKVAALYVRIGDQVKEGQLLAQLDNTAQQLEYEQATKNLDSLTSVSAIGNAQQALATATQGLRSAELQLEYLISPDVYYWENQLAKDEESVRETQKAAEAAPTDASVQERLKKAKDLVGFAHDKLKEARKAYHDYVLDTFTTTTVDAKTGQQETYIAYPTPEEIVKTRQDIVIAQGAVDDAQNLYNALTGGHVPRDAAGSGLIALEQARLDLQTAERNLEATEITAPFSGTVVSVSAQLGPIGSVPTPSGDTESTTSVRSTAVLTIADLSTLYVKTYLDESDYTKLKVGNSAEIVFDALPQQTFTGRVVQVDPVISTSSGANAVSGLIELDPTPTNLLLGMGAAVDVIAAQAKDVVLAPLSALHEYAPGKYDVFVVQEGKLTPQPVEVGLQDLINAEIKSGLQPGDVVSTDPLATK